MLSNEEIIRLYRTATDEQTRDELLGELCLQNIGLIKTIAKEISEGGEVTEDHVQDGYIGLLEAMKNYDESKGKFTTHVFWYIKKYIRQADKRSDDWRERLIRQLIIQNPEWTNEDICKCIKAKKRLNCEKLVERLRMGITMISLDQDDKVKNRKRVQIPDKKNYIKQLEAKLDVDKLLNKLNANQRQVIDLLLAGKEPGEISKIINISPANVSEIIKRAKMRMGKKPKEYKGSNQYYAAKVRKYYQGEM